MTGSRGRSVGFVVLLLLPVTCASGEATDATGVSPTTSTEPSPSPTARDVLGLEDFFAPLEPGTYFMDADTDPSTALRVLFDVRVEGWSAWLGAVKFGEDNGHVAVSITTVVNLVTHGCRDHLAADPPVGPTVDDLATALTELAPFEVTSPPTDVTVDGYRGTHLELTVPDIDFDRCSGRNLKSWVAPMDAAEAGDAYYGYTGPGYREEFWILDVEGTRLMIAAERSAGSPAEDLSELEEILDSIRIEP